MFIVTERNGAYILNWEKVATLRPIKAQNKGYFKKGSLQYIHIGRDFTKAHLCRVLIYDVSFININELTPNDFYDLGYNGKGEYLAEPFNQRNPSPERVKYSFITLGELWEMVESATPSIVELGELFKYIKGSEVCKGVPTDIYHYHYNSEAIEQALEQIADNLQRIIDSTVWTRSNVSEALEDLEFMEWGISELNSIIDHFKDTRALNGVNLEGIYEGCPIENIEEAFEQIRENLEGAL